MSENIAGYIDRSYIKGHYYKYAGCPKPVVTTANIDTISSDILSKAMFVKVGNTAGGTFPPGYAEGDVYLVTTIEYGNSVYLQTAYNASNGYEYRRINSEGNWTKWLNLGQDTADVWTSISSINTDIGNIKNDLNSASTNASNALTNSNKAKSDASNAYNLASSVQSNFNTFKTGISGKGFGPKIVVATKTVKSASMSHQTDEWYTSPLQTLNISGYGFKTITAVFPGWGKPYDPLSDSGFFEGAGVTVLSSDYDTQYIRFWIGSFSKTDIKNWRFTFLIVGT